jgi:coatomer protein complex subunit epsilon
MLALMLQAPLYNGLAVCHMKMGEWEDAERDLLEALGRDAKDADTLANLVTVSYRCELLV